MNLAIPLLMFLYGLKQEQMKHVEFFCALLILLFINKVHIYSGAKKNSTV